MWECGNVRVAAEDPQLKWMIPLWVRGERHWTEDLNTKKKLHKGSCAAVFEEHLRSRSESAGANLHRSVPPLTGTETACHPP
eukprot:scaffold1170_cov256-Pinguiococcus_pyrenoidosus.AAC.2